MAEDELTRIAGLITERNAIDKLIAAIIDRPMTSGHLGEWIAAQVFDIELERSASTAAIDGHFRSGPLAGQTVNLKWYLKQEGLLDISESPNLDYYLVLTGPRSSLLTSRGGTRPWRIDHVYLFPRPEPAGRATITRGQDRDCGQRPQAAVDLGRDLSQPTQPTPATLRPPDTAA